MNRLVINTDEELVLNILKSIKRNNGHCPCQVEITNSTLCPCDDFYNGQCHCNLFVLQED